MKLKGIGASLLGGAIMLSFGVATASATLATSCTGIVSASNVTWTATSTGGIAPVAFLWSNGSTSTVQTNAYLPGTVTMGLTATDASSTMATTTCSATVLAPLATINIFTATPATITAGQSATLTWATTNASSTSVDNGIGAVASSSVVVAPLVTTTYTLSAMNSTGITTATTTVFVNATTTPPVATTTVPLFRRSALLINDNGHFFGKGMIVQSVGTGSFTAKVWGMTFTVTSSQAVVAGSYVDVKGTIDMTSSVVTAHIVKSFPSYKVIKTRTHESMDTKESHGSEMKKEKKHKGKSEGRGRGKQH
jgi:hypothetical protein